MVPPFKKEVKSSPEGPGCALRSLAGGGKAYGAGGEIDEKMLKSSGRIRIPAVPNLPAGFKKKSLRWRGGEYPRLASGEPQEGSPQVSDRRTAEGAM